MKTTYEVKPINTGYTIIIDYIIIQILICTKTACDFIVISSQSLFIIKTLFVITIIYIFDLMKCGGPSLHR